MPVLESAQQRKLTSILINRINCQLLRTVSALSFIHFFGRPVFYSVPFPPKFNVPFYIVLCTIYPTFCVCHLSLHSRFNFLQSTLIFNFDLCNIQIFAFDIQLFHKKQSSFRIRPSSSVECTFIFSHPTFRICAF